MSEQKLTKSDHYTQVYWTDETIEFSQEVDGLLVDIDCNYSRLLRSLLKSIKNICKFILSLNRNYRHYEWELLIKDKETGVYYSSLPTGSYDLEEINPEEKGNNNEEV